MTEDTGSALVTLAELDSVHARTRTTLRSFWFPLVVTGALSLGAGALAGFASSTVLGVYWLVGYATAFFVVGRYYGARAARVGLGGDARLYAALWIGLFAALFVAGSAAATVGGNRAEVGAQALVITLFYLLFARFQHSRLLAALGVAIGAFGVAVAIADPAHLVAIAAFGIGAGLVLSGLYARERDDAA